MIRESYLDLEVGVAMVVLRLHYQHLVRRNRRQTQGS
jgi:hypothetical protein